MKNYFLLFVLIASSQFALSQDTLQKIHRIHFNGLTVGFGKSVTEINQLSLDEYQRYYPQSIILGREYQGSGPNFYKTIPCNTFKLLTDFNFGNKKKACYRNNPTVRLGINYQGATAFSLETVYQDLVMYGEVYSSEWGFMGILDTLYENRLTVKYKYHQLLFDGSVIFKTSAPRRISFYTGIGVTVGTALNSKTTVKYQESAYNEIHFIEGSGFNDETNFDSNRYFSESETLGGLTNSSFTGYIPLGIEYAFGKRKESLRHFHLLLEVRPAFAFQKIEWSRMRKGFQLDGVFGLRFEM